MDAQLLGLRRAGLLQAWACPVALGPTGAPLPCSRAVSFRGARVSVRLPAGPRGKVRIVIVRRRHR